MLSSFSEVDFIVLKCESLRSLCDVIHPHQVYMLEGDGKLGLFRSCYSASFSNEGS